MSVVVGTVDVTDPPVRAVDPQVGHPCPGISLPPERTRDREDPGRRGRGGLPVRPGDTRRPDLGRHSADHRRPLGPLLLPGGQRGIGPTRAHHRDHLRGSAHLLRKPRRRTTLRRLGRGHDSRPRRGRAGGGRAHAADRRRGRGGAGGGDSTGSRFIRRNLRPARHGLPHIPRADGRNLRGPAGRQDNQPGDGHRRCNGTQHCDRAGNLRKAPKHATLSEPRPVIHGSGVSLERPPCRGQPGLLSPAAVDR